MLSRVADITTNVTFASQVRTSKTYSVDRVQMANATGNISTHRSLFSNFIAPCPDSVDGQVDGWDAEGYHAALQNWMKYCILVMESIRFELFVTKFSDSSISRRKLPKATKSNAARASCWLCNTASCPCRCCFLESFSTNRFVLSRSYIVIAAFCGCLVSSGFIRSWKRKRRCKISCCIVAGCGHYSSTLSCPSANVRHLPPLLSPSCCPGIGPNSFCNLGIVTC